MHLNGNIIFSPEFQDRPFLTKIVSTS